MREGGFGRVAVASWAASAMAMAMAMAMAIAMVVPAAAQEAGPVRIGWVYAMANAPVLIAEERGLFAEQGVEAVLESFTSGPLIRKGLTEGTLDLAYIGVPPIVHWSAKGADLAIVAKVNYGQASLLARRDAGIRTVADLAGRRLAGVRERSGMDVLLRGYVLGEVGGLAPADLALIETLPVGEMGAALEAGTYDAAFMWEPFVARLLVRRTARVVLNVNRAEPYYPWYVVAARREFLDAHPDRVKGVLRAWGEAPSVVEGVRLAAVEHHEFGYTEQTPEEVNALLVHKRHLGLAAAAEEYLTAKVAAACGS